MALGKRWIEVERGFVRFCDLTERSADGWEIELMSTLGRGTVAIHRRMLALAVVLGVGLAAIPLTATVGAVEAQSHVIKVNPKICPAPPVLAKALGVEVLQVNGNVSTGPNDDNTCNYLTNLEGGAPKWLPLVAFLWPTSKAEFDEQRTLERQPTDNLKIGNGAFALKAGGYLWALSGTTELEIKAGGAPVTTAQLAALAKKIL